MKFERPQIVRGTIIAVGLVFVIQLFALQVVDARYKLAAENNTIRRVPLYPYRGHIKDRNGKWLVVNIPTFDLEVTTREMEIADTVRFCRLLGLSREEFLAKMAEITDTAKNAGYSPVKPQQFLRQMSSEEYHRIRDVFNYPGFNFQARIARAYPDTLMAHALGYIAEVSPEEMDRDSTRYYRRGDLVGKSGIEKYYEPYLRGRRGVKYVMVNVRGVEQGSFNDGKLDSTSAAGEPLTCSVDIELQRFAESLLEGKKGSIVAIEPATGEILTIASAPNFDPNLLTTGREFAQNYGQLIKDRVLLDRATMSFHSPGSTFKPIVGLVALQDGVITPDMALSGGGIVEDHGGGGSLVTAIQRSSNGYFARCFIRTVQQQVKKDWREDSRYGFKRWREAVMKFGLGKRLGSDLPQEATGNIPTAESYDPKFPGGWNAESIFSLGIGQGEIVLTPLQLANEAAIIANRGYYIRPHLISSVGDRGPLPEFREKISVGVEGRHFEPVVEGMELVVLAGTARSAQIEGISMCGKTGTVQNGPRRGDQYLYKNHSVFIGFAPRDNPKIAIAVFIENAGYGSQWAAPMAGLVVERYLKGALSPQRAAQALQISEARFSKLRSER